jgi:AcrR family transcriptional regulator
MDDMPEGQTGARVDGAGTATDDASDVVDSAGNAIMDAAIRLLADGGLTAFTTDRLAAEARVSKTTIYRRWADKKAIFRAVLDRWGARAEVDDLGDFLVELDQWYADRQAKYNRAGFRLVAASLMEVAAHDLEVGEAMYADRRASWTTMREVLARAIERGEIDDDIDVDHLEQFFLGPIYYRALVDGQELDDATIAAFRRLALSAVGYDPNRTR